MKEYDAIIRNQIELGTVEHVKQRSSTDENISCIHYLPHDAVVRRDKDTTKVRVVYDASAKGNGTSLNNCLHAGPKFDQTIFDLLLKFRAHRVALMRRPFLWFRFPRRIVKSFDFCGSRI